MLFQHGYFSRLSALHIVDYDIMIYRICIFIAFKRHYSCTKISFTLRNAYILVLVVILVSGPEAFRFYTIYRPKVSEYDQDIPQSHTTDQPTILRGRATEHLK